MSINKSRANSGFTLVELITATAIFAIGATVIASVVQLGMVQYWRLKDRVDAEKSAMELELMMRLLFSQAINIEFSAADPIVNIPAMGPGQVIGVPAAATSIAVTTLIDQEADVNEWTVLALFMRESQTGRPDPVNPGPNPFFGNIRKTAIWYRRPQGSFPDPGPPPTTVTSKAGGIFVDTGPDPGSAAPLNVLVTNYTPNWFVTRIVRLEITKHSNMRTPPAPGDPIKKTTSVDFNVRFRYQLLGMRKTRMNWCASGDVAAANCVAPSTAFRDFDHSFSVLLRNNLMRSATDNVDGYSGAIEERALGNVYFFRPILPKSGRFQ